MHRIHAPIALTLTVAIFVTTSRADSITLKSGEHVEGKITRETDKDVTVEIKVSAGITDERVVPRVSIQKIDKVSPELMAYQAIERFQIRPNSLPAQQYEPYIDALQAYVQQYPNSVRAIDVQTVLNGFLEERRRVEAGEAKVDYKWLSKNEVEREKVQINGRLVFNYMKGQSTAGDFVGALNGFAVLEKNYPGAAVMPDAIDLALKIIPALKAEVDRAIPEEKALAAEREKGIKAAGKEQRAQIVGAVKQEEAVADAAAVAAEAANRWAPLNKNSAKCLTSLQARAIKEGERLAALHPETMRQSLEVTAAAQQSLNRGDTAAAARQLKEAVNLWKANELALRLTKDESAAPPIPVAATPAPAPATPTPAPKPKAALASPVLAAPIADAPASAVENGTPRWRMPVAMAAVVGVTVVLATANVFVRMHRRRTEQNLL